MPKRKGSGVGVRVKEDIGRALVHVGTNTVYIPRRGVCTVVCHKVTGVCTDA